MFVQKSQVVAILVGFGVDTAVGYSLSVLTARVNAEGGIKRYADPSDAQPADPELATLYAEMVAAQEAGNLIEIVDDPEPTPNPELSTTGGQTVPTTAAPTKPKRTKPKGAKPKTTKPAKPAATKRGENPTNGMTWGEKVQYWKKHPKPITDKGPGVLLRIVKELKAATADKPITKEKLLGILSRAFSDRQTAKMETYMNNMLPTGLRDEYGIHTWRTKQPSEHMAYWIEGDGKTPQPVEAKVASAKPKPAGKKTKQTGKKAAKKPAKKKAAKK